MSLRIAILRILASRPDGTVALATVRSELALLISAGRGASHARRNTPAPDIFSNGFVDQVGACWRISPAGRAYLEAYGEGRLEVEARATPAAESAAPRRPASGPVAAPATETDPAARPVVVVRNPDIDRRLTPLPALRTAGTARRTRMAGRR